MTSASSNGNTTMPMSTPTQKLELQVMTIIDSPYAPAAMKTA